MSTKNLEKGRRSAPKVELDIDRRNQREDRRDGDQRVWLDEAYEMIYLRAYMNMFHPKFDCRIHAFSNHMSEPSSAEWSVHALAERDAREKRTPRTLREFAREMIVAGLLLDEKGLKVGMESFDADKEKQLFLRSA